MPRIKLDLTIVLQVAAELADTQGIDQVTLASLAQKLNVRTPSLYNHIDGLPVLKQKLAVYGLEQLYQQLTHAGVGLAGDKAVRAFAQAYLIFARNRPGLYELTLRAAGPDDTEAAEIGGRIVDLISRILTAYQLTHEATIHTVRGFRSILHGFVSLERIGGFGLPVDLDKSFELLLDAFLMGIPAIHQTEGGD